MTFAALNVGQMPTAAPVGGGLNTSFYVAETNISPGVGVRGVTVTLNADGTTSGSPTTPPNWYLPTTGAIGNTYWVQFATLAGATGITWSGAARNTWLALSAGQSITAQNTTASGEGVGTLQISIATSSGGAGAVVIGTVDIAVGSVP